MDALYMYIYGERERGKRRREKEREREGLYKAVLRKMKCYLLENEWNRASS